MMNVMTYKDYMALVEFDPRDGIFVGRVLGIADDISFHGTTVAELTKEFHDAINHYLADCATTGRTPQKSASGKLMLRVPPEVQTAASIAAKAAGKSLNQWVAEALREAAMA